MTEDQLEQEALGWLADVGYQHRYGPELAPDGSTPERSKFAKCIAQLAVDHAGDKIGQ